MKHRFSHLLLFFVLIGNLSHAFHDHYGHEEENSTLGTNNCPICIVEDLNEVSYECSADAVEALYSISEAIDAVTSYSELHTTHYNTRAPPTC